MNPGTRSGGGIRGPKVAKPRRLRPGAVIGIAATASPFDRETFERGLQALRAMGFEVAVSDSLFAAQGYLAGSDEHRAEALQRLFENDSIDAIMCARGGYGSLRLLPLLDYERLCGHPKILIGFSDVTALLAVLTSRCGFVTFHGPVVTSLADASSETLAALREAVASDAPLSIRPPTAVAVRPGAASGPVCGGNLTTLCHLLGTPFETSFRDRILFLEDRGEAPYRIDRMLTQMKLAGCFQRIKGLALGAFTDCGSQQEVLEIVENRFGDAGVPILAGVEAGHSDPNLTIPFGVRAVLDADSRTLRFERATVD